MNTLVNDQLCPMELYKLIKSASKMSEIKSVRAHLELFTQRVQKNQPTPGYHADNIRDLWKVFHPQEAKIKDGEGHFNIILMEINSKLDELKEDLEKMVSNENLPEEGTPERFKVFTDRLSKFRAFIKKHKPYHVEYDWAPYKALRAQYEPFFQSQDTYREYVG